MNTPDGYRGDFCFFATWQRSRRRHILKNTKPSIFGERDGHLSDYQPSHFKVYMTYDNRICGDQQTSKTSEVSSVIAGKTSEV